MSCAQLFLEATDSQGFSGWAGGHRGAGKDADGRAQQRTSFARPHRGTVHGLTPKRHVIPKPGRAPALSLHAGDLYRYQFNSEARELEVDALAGGRLLARALERLGERGVRMTHSRDVLGRRTILHGQARLADQLTGLPRAAKKQLV
jgi:hypothetical protein